MKEMDNGAHIVVQLIDKQLLSLKQIFPQIRDQRTGRLSIYLREQAKGLQL